MKETAKKESELNSSINVLLLNGHVNKPFVVRASLLEILSLSRFLQPWLSYSHPCFILTSKNVYNYLFDVCHARTLEYIKPLIRNYLISRIYMMTCENQVVDLSP